MSSQLRGILLIVFLIGCRSDKARRHADEATARPRAGSDATRPPAKPDPDLLRAQDEYVEDVMAFAKSTHDEVRARMKKGSNPLKDEWNAWEAQGTMTPDRIKEFY